MRIGILTGGGDVPGLNPCIKAAVHAAEERGWDVLGIRRGWAGLLDFNPDDPASRVANTLPLNRQNTRTIDRSGGTFLHTSRTNPGKVRQRELPAFLHQRRRHNGAERSGAATTTEAGPTDCTPHILRVIEHLQLDVLIPIGGDDTLSYGERLSREGVPIVAVPKTMDNDVFGTDYCIGFSTAVSRSVAIINQLRSSAGSHERIAVIELFGRNCGETSLLSSYLADADRAIIPEVPFDPERLAELVMRDKRDNPSGYAVVTMSEGAHMLGGTPVEYGEEDAYGHRKLGGIGLITGEALKKITGQDIMYQQLGYLMRSGAPDSLDLMVPVNYALIALALAERGSFGRLVVMREGRYGDAPIGVTQQG
ncbi:MAG TPA: 6-phosphofructokinase, partial [Chloroflexota bacterium]|nr:6-phosphofructokinase [Chloroflexota bacterium]